MTAPTPQTSDDTVCAPDDLHCRLVKILDGGAAAVDERLKELDDAVANPSIRASIIAGGEKVLHKLFGARFAPKPGDVAHLDPLDIERERMALRALRGDFRDLPTVHEIEDRHALLRMEAEGGPAVERDDRLDRDAAVDAVLHATGNG
jgi:hypothetical protein